MKEIVLSIITVCLNCADDLQKTFASVYKQLEYVCCKDLEYIVVDGLSSDNTTDVVKNYLKKIEKRGISTTFISEKDEGIYDAMNKGLIHAHGQWIYILNAGDVLNNNNVLRVILHKLKKTKADIIYGNALRTNIYFKEKWVPEELDKIKKNMIFCHQALFIKRNLYGHYYDTKYKLCADYNMVLKFYLMGYKFEYIDITIVNYSTDGITGKSKIIEAYKDINKVRYDNKIIDQPILEGIFFYFGLVKRYVIRFMPERLRWKATKIFHLVK